MSAALEGLKYITEALEAAETMPYGPVGGAQTQRVAGAAAVKLCGGDANKARSLWKQIAHVLGYDAKALPHAACVALIHASKGFEFVPDVTAPEL